MMDLIGPLSETPTYPTPWTFSTDDAGFENILDADGDLILYGAGSDSRLTEAVVKAVNEYYGNRSAFRSDVSETLEHLARVVEKRDARIQELEQENANLLDIQKSDEKRLSALHIRLGTEQMKADEAKAYISELEAMCSSWRKVAYRENLKNEETWEDVRAAAIARVQVTEEGIAAAREAQETLRRVYSGDVEPDVPIDTRLKNAHGEVWYAGIDGDWFLYNDRGEQIESEFWIDRSEEGPWVEVLDGDDD